MISLKSGVDLKLNEINTNQMGIPYLTGASCFNNGNLDIIRWTKFPTNITHKGDLLITVKGTIGEMAFNNIGDAHIARQIMSISISPYINPFYVFYVLEARKNELIQKSSSLIPGITRDNLLLFQIAVPPRNEQDKIVETLKTSLDKIQIIKENIEEISNISALIKSQILSSVFTERSSYKSYYHYTPLENEIISISLNNKEVKTKNVLKQGKYKVVSQSKNDYDGFTNDENKIIHDVPCIVFGDHTRIVKKQLYPFAPGADGTKVIKPNKLNVDYFYYCILYASQLIENRGYGRHFALLKKQVIPIADETIQIEVANYINQAFKLLDDIIQ